MDRNSTMKVLIKSLLEPVSNFHINRFFISDKTECRLIFGLFSIGASGFRLTVWGARLKLQGVPHHQIRSC